MDIALVQDLSDLAPRLPDGHNNAAGLKEATSLLAQIDKRLQENPSLATRLGATPLPALLATLLRARPHPQDADEAALDAFFPLIRLDALVASRLAVDSAPNVAALHAARWPATALGILLNAAHMPPEVWRAEAVRRYAPLISGLATLLTGRDAEPVVRALSTAENFAQLARLAAAAHVPGDWDADAQKARVRGTVAQALHELLAALAQRAEFALSPAVLEGFLPVLRFWTTGAAHPAPADLGELGKDACLANYGPELVCLHALARVLHGFTATERVDWPALAADDAVLKAMAEFIEHPGAPGWIDQSHWEGQTAQATEQVVGMAATHVGQTLLLLIGHAAVPAWLGARTQAWLDDPALAAQGLSALANTIHDGAAARAALQRPGLRARVLALLQREEAPDVPTQHALLGLLRNLTIPAENVPLLGRAVVAGVLRLRPFVAARDGADALQRNAVLALTHLVADGALAPALLADEQALVDLMLLLARTRAGALRAQIVGLLAAAVGALPPWPEARDAWDVLAADDGLWVCLILGIDDGRQVPVLLASAMRAFLHGLEGDCPERPAATEGTSSKAAGGSASRGDKGKKADNGKDARKAEGAEKGEEQPEGVRAQLVKAFGRKLGSTGETGVASLARIVAPPDDVYEIPAEVQADAVRFVRLFNEKSVTGAVQRAVERNRQAKRPVAKTW